MPSLDETPLLTASEIDDLLYLTRTNDTPELIPLLHHLATKNSCTVAKILLDCTDPDSGNTPLHYASANAHLSLLQTLLSFFDSNDDATSAAAKRLFVNAVNSEGNTPLHWASVNGHLEIVKVLVGAGADVEVKNGAGLGAASEAERAGREGVVEWLLLHGEIGDGDVAEGLDGEGVEGVGVVEGANGTSRDVEMEEEGEGKGEAR